MAVFFNAFELRLGNVLTRYGDLHFCFFFTNLTALTWGATLMIGHIQCGRVGYSADVLYLYIFFLYSCTGERFFPLPKIVAL